MANPLQTGLRGPFDQRVLAQQTLAEADAFLRSIGLPAEIDQAAYIASRKREHPIPSERVLSQVLEEVFYASLASDEGRVCRLRLVFEGTTEEVAARAHASSSAATHRLTDPIPLDRDSLRRMSPVHDAAQGALCWSEGEEGASLVGIGVPSGLRGTSRPELMIAAPAPAHLIVGYYDRALVAHRRGETFLRRACALPDLQRLSAFLGTDFGEASALMPRAAMAIADEGHGGSLWVVGGEPPMRGVRLNYPLRGAHEPDVSGGERRRAAVHSLGKLASTDGAVVLDLEGHLLGFGGFYSGSWPAELDVLRADGRTVRVSFASLGGGRHRAAAAFCAANAPAAALVVSQDQQITIMRCVPGCLPLVAEVGPFGRESGA
ncbi:MAG: hypothetical protein J0L92_22900 [Deltaproteobacteria bacterium]|nr:hypothetical protein [Deltaproteobacteria bacterium]